MIASAAGLLVALMFLAFSVQIMLSLYATSVLRATLHDAASRAANHGTANAPADLEQLAAEAEASLGRMGERTQISLEVLDTDGNGIGDVIAGDARTVPPRVVPASVGGMIGFEEITVGVRVRIERPR
jgi:hypothetical protein